MCIASPFGMPPAISYEPLRLGSACGNYSRGACCWERGWPWRVCSRTFHALDAMYLPGAKKTGPGGGLVEGFPSSPWPDAMFHVLTGETPRWNSFFLPLQPGGPPISIFSHPLPGQDPQPEPRAVPRSSQGSDEAVGRGGDGRKKGGSLDLPMIDEVCIPPDWGCMRAPEGIMSVPAKCIIVAAFHLVGFFLGASFSVQRFEVQVSSLGPVLLACSMEPL